MWISVIASLLGGKSGNLPSSNGKKPPVDERDLFYFQERCQVAEREAELDVHLGRFVDFESVRHLADALCASGTPKAVPQLEQLRAMTHGRDGVAS